ncbi:MAG: helix-turn-helix transcriptional regulator [Phycisphaerales bacterium]|nr:helix-turn-helix transcriptional regulator [Phycisphaerales bacterium]
MGTFAPTISIQATEQIVDALNSAAELEGGPEGRLEFLLKRLQVLLERDSRCALWLVDQLQRVPAPRLVSRCVVRPSWDNYSVQDTAFVQAALDDAVPVSRVMIPRMLKKIRTPSTIIASEAGDNEWFDNVLVKQYLSKIGYADCVASFWAASRDHAVILVFYRRAEDRPFSERDETLISLMLRSVAPIVDREIFRRDDSYSAPALSPREREVLLMLLAGDSEKEIAAGIHRSIHTVHTFVQKLYGLFKVSSRGELMAQFIDKAVFQSLGRVPSN